MINMRVILVCLMTFNSLFAQDLNEERQKRTKWFRDARFGMFIHWGVYSGAEGYWKGEKLRDDNNYAEWIQYRNRIDKDEYLTLLDRFDWDEIDPEEWVILAKKAGMKYVTITAKHHDGFALFDSKVSDYDVADHTNPSRDIIKELSDACQKHGLKMGLYYSHWVDWEHPYGWDHTKEINPITDEQYDQYWQEKVVPQMTELLTNYGPIGIIWFDMWIHHSETIVKKEQLLQLKNMIRELQPGCLVNSRLGLSVEEDADVDFQTLGDNQLGDTKKDYAWQTSATVAHSWGFHATDTEWKSTTTLLQSLINNVSLNGNFMLNIGPRADGSVPYEISSRLLEMGDWLAVNGESIYGSGAVDLRKNLHDWGRITFKSSEEENLKLYLHVNNWPLNHKLPLTGISTPPQKIYLLSDKQRKPLDFQFNEVFTDISLPVLSPDQRIPVVVVEYDQYPKIRQELVAKSVYGGYSFTPENWIEANGDTQIVEKERRGSIPDHVVIDESSTYQWKFFVDQAGFMEADISYSYQGQDPAGRIIMEVGDTTLEHSISYSGKTITEPNRDWVIDNFKSSQIGKINFPKPGFYQVSFTVNVKQDEPVKFQWIWID